MLKLVSVLLFVLLSWLPARADGPGGGDMTAWCNKVVAISQTASTKVISGVTGKRIYICAILIVANAAEVVGIIEGTGTTCATGETAVMGSTTDANAMSFAANGGFAMAAASPFLVTINPTDDLCVQQSSTSRVTGFISYAIM